MRKQMRALSLHRPWSTLVLEAGKDVENRSWKTSYRGTFLVHGAKAWSSGAFDIAEMINWATERFDLSPMPSIESEDHATGIVGAVDLVDICETTAGVGGYCGCGPWAMSGNYHWRLANPRPFAVAIPCPGRQQLWTPPETTWGAIDRELARAVNTRV